MKLECPNCDAHVFQINKTRVASVGGVRVSKLKDENEKLKLIIEERSREILDLNFICDRNIEDSKRYSKALEKIRDPRLRDHKKSDKYTEVGCMMNIADEALEGK